MVHFKRIFLVDIFLFVYLVQTGFAQSFEDQHAERQFSDWQPSRSTVRNKPSIRNDGASLYNQVPTKSSPNLTNRDGQRVRGRNSPDPYADIQYNNYYNVEQGYEVPTIQGNGQTVKNENVRSMRHKNNVRTATGERWNTDGQSRKTGYRDTAESDLYRSDRIKSSEPQPISRRNENGFEFQAKRTQRPRTRNEPERRTTLATEDTARLGETNFIQRPAATNRGRRPYAEPQEVNTGTQIRERTPAFTSRYRNLETTQVPKLTERSDLNYNPPQQQQQIKEVNRRTSQVRSDAETNNFRRWHQKQPPIETNLLYNGNNDVQFQTYDARVSSPQFRPTEKVRPDNGYQIPSDPSSYNLVSPVPQYAEVKQQPEIQSTTFADVPSVTQFAPPRKSVEQSKQQVPADTVQPFRGRQTSRRSETTSSTERTPQFVYAESQKPRSNFRRGNRPDSSVRSNLVTDNNLDGGNARTGVQTVDIERQRRRQGPSRGNQRTRVHTVFPSNVETTTNVNDYTTSTTETTTTAFTSRNEYNSRTRVENVPPRFTVYRSRYRGHLSKNKEAVETSNVQAGEVGDVRKTTEVIPPAQTTQTAAVSPTTKSGRPISRTAGTNAPPPSKADEEIDATANYPREFLENIKTSKEYVPTPKYEVKNSYITSFVEPITAADDSRGRLRHKIVTPKVSSLLESTTVRVETNKKVGGTINHQNVETEVMSTTTRTITTPRERYSQSFYRKLSAKTSSNSANRKLPEFQKSEYTVKNRSPEFKFKSFVGRTTTTTTTAAPFSNGEEETSATETAKERRKFVPKNKVSLEERKHRIELLKEKLRQNATELELKTKNQKESLIVQANTHPGSLEDESHAAMFVASTTTKSHPTIKGVRKDQASKQFALNAQFLSNRNKSDLVTLASEDNVHVVYVTNSTTKSIGSTESLRVTTTPSPPSTTDGDVASTTTADFSVLNVTLFPSTRHRFSARINSTVNLTLPPDVELVTLAPTPSVLETLEITATQESPIVLSIESLFNSSLNTSVAADKSPDTISVTNLFASSTISDTATTPKSTPPRTTTKRTAKKPGRKIKKKSKSASRTTLRGEGGPRNRIATTVRTAETNSERNSSNPSSDVQSPTLAPSEVESILRETEQVVNSNPMTGFQAGTVPRSELNAVTPETRNVASNQTDRLMVSVTVTNFTGNSTNTREVSETRTDVRCEGESCRNATSQSVLIERDSVRQSGTTKSPETLRKLFIYGIFPNNTVQRRPFTFENTTRTNESSERLTVTTTTTTTTQSVADYDVFGIYPNNSIVRRRGWKTFDHERYQSPYVIFGIYPNNTIVKKYPNGTIINDEFMVSDNEIRKMVADEKSRGCACATSTTTARSSATSNATETTERMTTESSGTEGPQKNAKADAESVNVGNINSENEDARDTEEATTTESTESVTRSSDEDEIEENNEEDEDEEDDGDDDDDESDNGDFTTSSSTTDNATEGPDDDSNGEDTTQPEENVTRGLVDAEETDDASTPTNTLGSDSKQSDDRGGLQEAEEVDGRNLSTTETNGQEQLEGLVNAEKADAINIISSTEASGGSSKEPTERFELYNSITTPYPVYGTTQKNAHTPARISFIDALLGNLLGVSKRLGISTLAPFVEGQTGRTLRPQIPTGRSPHSDDIDRDALLKVVSTTTQRPLSTTDEGLSIDLGFGLENLEVTTSAANEENSSPTTTTASTTPTTTSPAGENTQKENLSEVEALDISDVSTTTEPTEESLQQTERGGEISTTTESTIGVIQRNNPSVEFAPRQRADQFSGFRYETPQPKRLGASGIYSISFDGNDLVTPVSALENYHEFGQPTTPFYYSDSSTLRPVVSDGTEILNLAPGIDVHLGSLLEKINAALGNGPPPAPILHANFDSPTEAYFPESTTTSSELLDSLLPLSVDFLQSSQNKIQKRQRKSTNELDEPSSLTNLAYRALSSNGSNKTLLPNITTRPKTKTKTMATKLPDGSTGRPKKLKNLSRTSVMAFKNMTELTSTPMLESVYIVTPVPKTNDNDKQDDLKRGKVKFVTLTPGFVVTTNLQPEENEIQTLSSQHVQKVTKAPANIPDNFLSTVVGEIEEKASSPIPEIIKNVGNDLQGDGLSVNLAKRIITLALEKAATSTTTQVPLQLQTTIRPTTTFDLETPSPFSINILTTPKAHVDKTQSPPTTTTTTTGKPRPVPEKKVEPQSQTTWSTATTAASTDAIVITPKRQVVEQLDLSKLLKAGDQVSSVSSTSEVNNKASMKIAPGLDPVEVFPDNPGPTKTPSSQKVTEDLNALLSGLWQETSTPSAPKSTPKPTSKPSPAPNSPSKSSKVKRVKNEKISVPKKASDSLSESDLRLLESILNQQGAKGATQDLEQIIQNQIRLAEEVRKASRNLKKKQRTTTTTTPKPVSGGLGFLLSLFGGNAKLSSPPESRPKRPVRPLSESFANLNNTPDPLNELDEGYVMGDRTPRGELVSAAIDVTKAVSRFMGTVLTNAAQSFQNFIRSFRS